MFAQWRCNYVNVDGKSYIEVGDAATAGVTCFTTTAGTSYAYSREDSIDQTVQDLSQATVIMGAVAWCFYLLAGCCKFPPPLWLLVSLICAATAVTEGLVFQQIFNSDFCANDCSWGTGAKCAISGTYIMLIQIEQYLFHVD